MTYRLKPGQPGIEIVDGPFAGRKYMPGQAYDEVPPEERHRFERAELAPVVPIPPPKTKSRSSRTIEDESA